MKSNFGSTEQRIFPSRGFTLVEVLIVLAIAAYGVIWLGWSKVEELRKATAVAAANHIDLVGKAVQSYVANNMTALEAAPSTTLTVATLKTAGSCGGSTACLSANVSANNVWGAGYNIRILRKGASSPYQMEFLVVTTASGSASGSYVIGGLTRTDLVGYAAAKVGTNVGFTNRIGGPLMARGVGGAWQAPVSDYPAIVGGPTGDGGQLAYFYSQVGMPYDSTYLRIDGGNRMTGNLNLGNMGVYGLGRGINNPTVVAASSNGTNDIHISGSANIAGPVQAQSTLTVSGTSKLDGDITAGGNVAMTSSTGDLTMQSLTNSSKVTGGVPFTSKSVTALMPKIVEVGTFVVGHGSSVPAPACQAGGSPRIFVVPSSAIASVTNGVVGYVFKSGGLSGGFWVISLTDHNNLPISGPDIAVARTSCVF